MKKEDMADEIGKMVTTIDTGAEKLPEIIRSVDALKVICEPVESKEEGERIAKLLFQVLDTHKGAGLSAPQIGINKRVFAVHVRKPMYFINPKIEEMEGEVVYIESCLSFPVFVRTKRSATFKLTADNLTGPIICDVSHIPAELRMQDPSVFEMVVIQHEFDHLDGILMFDREYKAQPIRVEGGYGRNERVSITDGHTIVGMKYKKAELLLKDGKWKLV